MSVPSWVQNVNLAATPRKHLQDIAKLHGIKANVKTGHTSPPPPPPHTPPLSSRNFAAEIVEQLEAIKSTLLNQRAPSAASSKPSKQPSPRKPSSPVFSPGRCAAAASDDAKSPRVPQLNFGSGSKLVRSIRSIQSITRLRPPIIS
jgi:hypothetical protein